MAQFNVHQAKTQFSRLLAKAEAGDDVVIARDGVPVVRLVPVSNATGELPPRRRIGMLEGQGGPLIEIFDNWTAQDQAELESLFYDGPIFPDDK